MDTDPAQEITRLENELDARQMSIRQLESLLKSQNWMKEHAESARDAMRGRLEYIAKSLCSKMVDDLTNESPDGMSLIGHEELTDAIIADVNRRIDILEASANGRGMSNADAENVELQRKIIRLEGALEKEKASHEKTRQNLGKVQSTLDAALTSRNTEPAPVVEADTVPEWLSELKEWSLFDRGMKLLQIVAETGMARRLDVTNAYGNAIEADSQPRNDRRMFPSLKKRGLIDILTVESETMGASTQDLVRLSDRGKETCRLVLRLTPVPDEIERLLPRRKTLPGVLLVLEAAEILRDAGFTVDVAPAPVDVPQSDRRLALDMKVTFEGETTFVMVEGKDSAGDWNRKWQDHYDAIGDSFYVVVASEKLKSRLLSNVNRWIQKNKRGVKLRMTNISAARGKGRRGNDIWTIRRNLGGNEG